MSRAAPRPPSPGAEGTALAWPVARFRDAGWRLRVAWGYNSFLLIGGLLWLGVMLRALDLDSPGAPNATAFWRTFLIGLAQAFFVQDVIKVLLISFISPAFWARILTPGTKRAERLRFCMRLTINSLTPFL